MVDQGIILPVDNGESNLLTSLVIREMPDGRLYIYLDAKDLNKVIKRECHPAQTVDDITLRLCATKQFCKLEATQGY